MATGTRRTVTTKRHEFAVPAEWPQGSNLTELHKVITWAENSWREAHPGQTMYDDSIWVLGNEEEIVVYWDEEIKP